MNNPVWIDEKGKIIEPEYCRDFLSRHPMRCINDRFYTVDGPLPDESKLKRTIYEEISPWLHAKVAQTVEQMLNGLKPYNYLTYVMERMKEFGPFPEKEAMRELLPWSNSLPADCHSKLKK